MTRMRKLLTIAAVMLAVTALVPSATASPGAPLRATGSAYFDGNGWASQFSGDLNCSGYETSEVQIVGPEPLVIGTMHWIGVTVLTCGDGPLQIVPLVVRKFRVVEADDVALYLPEGVEPGTLADDLRADLDRALVAAAKAVA